MTLDEAKMVCDIPWAWNATARPGAPPSRDGTSASCPFPERHRNNDAHPSFATYDNGQSGKCFACGFSGDGIDIVCDALNLTVSEAIPWISEQIGLPQPRRALKRTSGTRVPAQKPNSTKEAGAPGQMPENIERIWRAGCKSLEQKPAMMTAIDEWRAWPEGTKRTLLDDGLISAPTVHDSSGLAFPVQHPTRGGWIQAGFHFRPKLKDGERHRWLYMPSGIPSLPFVLGSGYAETSSRVVVFEGQWDAVCFSAAAGWLAHDTAWPEEAVVFGTRGANGWRSLLDHWSFPSKATIFLFPDNDPAGQAWRGEFCERLKPLCREIVVRTATGGAKDFTDVLRTEKLSPPELCNLLAS